MLLSDLDEDTLMMIDVIQSALKVPYFEKATDFVIAHYNDNTKQNEYYSCIGDEDPLEEYKAENNPDMIIMDSQEHNNQET